MSKDSFRPIMYYAMAILALLVSGCSRIPTQVIIGATAPATTSQTASVTSTPTIIPTNRPSLTPTFTSTPKLTRTPTPTFTPKVYISIYLAGGSLRLIQSGLFAQIKIGDKTYDPPDPTVHEIAVIEFFSDLSDLTQLCHPENYQVLILSYGFGNGNVAFGPPSACYLDPKSQVVGYIWVVKKGAVNWSLDLPYVSIPIPIPYNYK